MLSSVTSCIPQTEQHGAFRLARMSDELSGEEARKRTRTQWCPQRAELHRNRVQMGGTFRTLIITTASQ